MAALNLPFLPSHRLVRGKSRHRESGVNFSISPRILRFQSAPNITGGIRRLLSSSSLEFQRPLPPPFTPLISMRRVYRTDRESRPICACLSFFPYSIHPYIYIYPYMCVCARIYIYPFINIAGRTIISLVSNLSRTKAKKDRYSESFAVVF